MTIFLKNKHTLQIDDFNFNCCIGKNGVTKRKREGDFKTPLGFFTIGKLFFRKDRIKKPKTLLRLIEIKKNMGWCDDISHPKKYNQLIKINNKDLDISNKFEIAMNDVDLISNYTINKFNQNFIFYEVIFNGTPKKFINIMSNKNYMFNTQKKIWILK